MCNISLWVGNARAYDAHMQKLRNDKFFASLRNQKPVYSVKAWEKDYEHQVSYTSYLLSKSLIFNHVHNICTEI